MAKLPNKDSAKDLLNLRIELCFLSTKQASMASAVSAMNCWASFALQNLDDDVDEILPPKVEGHVVEWIAGFRSGATTSNDVGILR